MNSLRNTASVLALMMALATATQAATSTALRDLSNVPAANVAAKTFAVAPGTALRSLGQRFGELANVKDSGTGAVGDGTANDCPAFASAAGTGRPIYVPPGTYKLLDCYLTLAGGQTIAGSGRSITTLNFTYTGTPTGPAITMGNSSVLSQNISLRNLTLNTAQAQWAIWTRWTRGARLYDVLMGCDGCIKLGDDAAGTGKPTYVAELFDGTEINQQLVPTLDVIAAYNFAGQWTADHAYITAGCASPCLATMTTYGFNATPNIQQRIDHFTVTGGYLSRALVNYRFADARVVNFYMTNHHTENATSHAIEFSIPVGSVKASGYTGAENVYISNTAVDAIGEAIYVKNASPIAAAFDSFRLSDIASTGAQGTKTPIYIEQSGANALIYDFEISGIGGSFTPADANQDGVLLKGDTNVNKMRNMIVRGVSLGAVGTAMRSGVRVEGAGARLVDVSGLSPFNITKIMDDQTGAFGAVKRDGAWVTSVTRTFNAGSVPANTVSTASSLSMVSGNNASTADSVQLTPQFSPSAGISFAARESTAGNVDLYLNNGTGSAFVNSNLTFTVRVTPAQ